MGGGGHYVTFIATCARVILGNVRFSLLPSAKQQRKIAKCGVL